MKVSRQAFLLRIGTIGILLLGVYLGRSWVSGILASWKDFWSHLVGIATLVVACIVWIGEFRQDWLSWLPSKLTVRFFYNHQEVMQCRLADLASTGDMRALGQQIGRQMVANQDLHLKIPSIKSSGGGTEVDPEGNIFRHYTIRFELNKLPDPLLRLNEGEYLLWEPPFLEQGEIKLLNTDGEKS